MNYLKIGVSDIIKTADTFNNIINILEINVKCFGSGITLTSNEIKDIIKVVESLENRGVLLKGSGRIITSQKGRFSKYL